MDRRKISEGRRKVLLSNQHRKQAFCGNVPKVAEMCRKCAENLIAGIYERKYLRWCKFYKKIFSELWKRATLVWDDFWAVLATLVRLRRRNLRRQHPQNHPTLKSLVYRAPKRFSCKTFTIGKIFVHRFRLLNFRHISATFGTFPQKTCFLCWLFNKTFRRP